ncbi:MAG: o-succinylbenzoate synthase [Acidimicrobiaceae bacterium]|nr:o-succinylbenzoate synthase [Acidimicrobiaceae bacterium]MBT6091495.1 o-succinylbenzoate synthase [Acidimicrobiaceae bacterium]
MRIAEARVERRLLRYHSPITTAHGTIADRWMVLLTLVDEDGNIGLGEAAPLAGFTPDTVEIAESALRRWAADQAGDGDPPASVTARAAVDSALLDLAARIAATSVHRLLAPESPDRLAVSALATGASVEAIAASAAAAVAAGHGTVKIKVGTHGMNGDLDRVSAVRSRIGPDVRLRLDANGAWGVPEALRHLDRLAEFDIEFLEEPVAGIENLAAVRNSSPVPIAVDESAPTVEDISRAVETGAADLVVLKPSAIGGPSEAARAAAIVRDAGMNVVVTSLLEGSVGIRAAAHLASAIGAVDPAPGLATASLLAVDVATPFLPVNGELLLG